ncbi:uncharacterized protein LOC135130565 [Zophobas morio]|uniref:uncharacterized protein LOC135130565 n=1 Tax=Zophobas morio TaxID=2755281 RepID=UPI00308289D4
MATHNIFDALNSLKDIFGPISNVVNLAVYLTFPVVGYSACCGGGLMIYMVLHIKFHVYCISHRLEELSTRKVCDYSKMDEFHMEVRSDLKTCIRCHQVIQIAIRKLNDAIYLPFIILFLIGLIVLVGVFINSTLYEIQAATDYVFIVHYLVISSIVPAALIYVAQTLINEYEKISVNLLNCSWYEWNSTNKTAMLMFLQNSQKLVCIGDRNMIHMEFSFVPKGLKFLWSTSVFFIQIVSPRK